MSYTAAKAEAARRMSDRRRELIARPLSEIWEDLAEAAIGPRDPAPSSDEADREAMARELCRQDVPWNWQGKNRDAWVEIEWKGYLKKADAILALPLRRSAATTDEPFTVDIAWQEILDKDDRNSPEEYPEMVMLTYDEFRDYMQRAAAPTPSPETLSSEAIPTLQAKSPEAPTPRTTASNAEPVAFPGLHIDDLRETVIQYRACWEEGLDQAGTIAASSDNWDGSDHNIRGLNDVLDAFMRLSATPPSVGNADAVREKHLTRIILGLFNPAPDKHAKGCLHDDPHIHPRGPCTCGYSTVAGEYLWSLREAKQIVAEKFGREAVDECLRLDEPQELIDRAALSAPVEGAWQEALKPLAELNLWRDSYPDGPDIIGDQRLQGYFTPDQVRAARAALSRHERGTP